jgi:hypothetical protein
MDGCSGLSTGDAEVLLEGTVKHRKRALLSISTDGQFFRNDRFSVIECFENSLGAHQVPRCHQKPCQGPSLVEEATVSKWPHTFILDCSNELDISHLEPYVFIYRQKKFVLRGVILVGGYHFTTVIRSPLHWVHCDGIADKKFNNKRFKYYPLNDSIGAQGGRKVCKAAFEVLDEHLPEFQNDRNSRMTLWTGVLYLMV